VTGERPTSKRVSQLLSTDTTLPELNEHNRRKASVADHTAVTFWHVRHTADCLAAAETLRPGTTITDLIELATGPVA